MRPQQGRDHLHAPTPTSGSSSATSRSPQKIAELQAAATATRSCSSRTTPRTPSSTCARSSRSSPTAGILAEGMLSLQSMDEGTLDAIRRSNIKLEKYDELADRVPPQRAAPGGRPHDGPARIDARRRSATTSSSASTATCGPGCNPTELLLNSPMNDPEYRGEHGIETMPAGHRRLVASPTRPARRRSSSRPPPTPATDYQEMERCRIMFILFENFGVLRQVSRFVRQETGIREMEFYKRMLRRRPGRARSAGRRSTSRFEHDHRVHGPPGELAVLHRRDRPLPRRPSSGSPTTRRSTPCCDVQHALLPARDREFPVTLELAHDFAAWHDAMMAAKHTGAKQTWEAEVPPLRSFGPTTFEVDDPQSISTLGLGMSVTYDPDSDWELAVPGGSHHAVPPHRARLTPPRRLGRPGRVSPRRPPGSAGRPG